MRLVDGLQPKTLLMENVPGILTINDGQVIEEITNRLTVLGYDCVVELINAEEFGTPQSRRRVFIAGSRLGPAKELIPPPHPLETRVACTSSGRGLISPR